MTIGEFFSYGWQATKIAFSTIASLTITVVATAKTMERSAGSWITDGFLVGDRVTFTGFAAGGNNSTFEITVLTATIITLGYATGLVDVTDDTDVSAHLGDRVVNNGHSLLGRLRVITSSDDVTLYDDDVAAWDVVDSTAELDLGSTPMYFNTSLRLVCATPAEAWAFFKAV